MFRLLTILVPLTVLLLAASACDGDGGPDGSSTPGSGPDSTSQRVIPPDDVAEFLDQFADQEVIQELCTFDAATGQVDCGENGVYGPDPLPDEDAGCNLLLADGEPAALACAVQAPLSVTYYVIE